MHKIPIMPQYNNDFFKLYLFISFNAFIKTKTDSFNDTNVFKKYNLPCNPRRIKILLTVKEHKLLNKLLDRICGFLKMQ